MMCIYLYIHDVYIYIYDVYIYDVYIYIYIVMFMYIYKWTNYVVIQEAEILWGQCPRGEDQGVGWLLKDHPI